MSFQTEALVIKCVTEIDASTLQKQVDERIGKGVKVDIRFNTDLPKGLEGRLAKVGEEFKRTKTDITTLSKWTNKAGQEFTDVTKRVDTFKDAAGRSRQVVSYLSSDMQVLQSRVAKASETFKPFENTVTNLTTTTDKYKKIVDGVPKTFTEVTTKIEDASGAIKTLKTVTEEYTDTQGYLVRETKQYEELNGKMEETGTATKDLIKDTTKLKSHGENLINANKKLGQSFVDVINKVAKFYLATLPIRMVQKLVTSTTKTIKEFDDAFVEMSKVADSSGQALTRYTQKLGDLGKEVARTRTEMTEGATGWLKAGYSEEDAAKLARYTALLQNTADEQLDAGEATSILVSQLKAYNMSADDAIVVTDVLNAVSAQQAVSSGDLAKGLTQASASMATYGNDLYKTSALLVAGTTIDLTLKSRSKTLLIDWKPLKTYLLNYDSNIHNGNA